MVTKIQITQNGVCGGENYVPFKLRSQRQPWFFMHRSWAIILCIQMFINICTSLLYTSRSIDIVYSTGRVSEALDFFRLAIHLGARSIPEHRELSHCFPQLCNILCCGNTRLHWRSPLLVGRVQSFITINRASGTILTGGLIGYVDKFWCRWDSWGKTYWVKGFVKKVPKSKWRKVSNRSEATRPRSQLLGGGALCASGQRRFGAQALSHPALRITASFFLSSRNWPSAL